MPRLSIGLPVYNGENYIEQALSSLLAQTFTDFELIIADNASTDRTGEICRRHAAQDTRLRYFRHERNMGAAYNFNFVFAQACGEFFRWASHDDVLAPEYLERCLEVLERDPDTVLCHARTDMIDDDGTFLRHDDFPMRIGSATPHERFRDLSVVRHDCIMVFGLARRDLLTRTPLIGNYVGSDRVLLCELALYGKLHEVPDTLFFRRGHTASSCWLPEREERVSWFDPAKAGTITYPNWRILRETIAAVHRVPQPLASTLACYLRVPEHVGARTRFLVEDLIEGAKLSLKRTRLGYAFFRLLKRVVKPDAGTTATDNTPARRR